MISRARAGPRHVSLSIPSSWPRRPKPEVIFFDSQKPQDSHSRLSQQFGHFRDVREAAICWHGLIMSHKRPPASRNTVAGIGYSFYL
jgi:hypothetical protein